MSQLFDAQGRPVHTGWIARPIQAAEYAATLDDGEDVWADLKAKDDGKDRYYYRALTLGLLACGQTRWLKDRDGVPVPRSYNQGSIGSCVGNGEAKRSAYIAALDQFLRLDAEAFRGMFSPEWSYYASRKESGMIGGGDGSTGYGAAKANLSMGVALQGKYGSLDLTEYSVSTCSQFGAGRGIPPEIVAEAAQHKCKRYIAVDTAEKVWLAAGAGLVYNQCSNVGWQGSRDKNGVIARRGSWSHSMTAGAGRRTLPNGRQVVLIDQSWGDDWTDGPYYLDEPWGTFWVYLEDAAAAAGQGDTFVDIDYAGHPLPAIPPTFTAI